MIQEKLIKDEEVPKKTKKTTVKITKAQQKKITSEINKHKKILEKSFKNEVQKEVKEYIDRNLPDLKIQRDESIKKVALYETLINKHSPIFSQEDYKTILMCLHPDGVRTKEKYEEAFRLFKEKETQLIGKKKGN